MSKKLLDIPADMWYPIEDKERRWDMFTIAPDGVTVVLDQGMTHTVERGKVFDIVDHELGMHAWFTDRREINGRVIWTLTPMTQSAQTVLDVRNATN